MFTGPALIDDGVIAAIDALSELAPLHNAPALASIAVARERLPDLPHIATFDTTFYAALPDHVALYAIPRELSEKHRVRRYGFHGLAHRYMVQRYTERNRAKESPRLITLQLGNGCSVTASIGGTPVETSMGFTPLEGLIMGTRAGDLDPAILLFLQRHAGLDADGLERLLERESGLRGLGGRSGDYAELERLAAGGDEAAELALELFAYRVRKYVGAYWAALGGVDLVVFTGGIGERSADARRRIVGPMAAVGWRLDPASNEGGPEERAVSPPGQRPAIWLIPTREALQIAREVRGLVG